jgi:hypothetical protein
MFVHMPQYHEPTQNWEGRGVIEIIPRPFFRHLPFLKYVIPYHVGDRIKFLIHTQIGNDRTGLLSHVVYENFRGEIKSLQDFYATDTEIIGNIINAEGDIEYLIGRGSGFHNAKTIFTTRVESWDTIISKWTWIVIGVIFSFLCGVLLWLLGFIELIPAWKAWINP